MNGKKVAVVGQVNRLHDELELLSKFASEILVLSPTGKFDEESMALLRSFEKVVLIPDRSIVRIPPGPTFNGLMVRSPSGEEGTIVCDAVFIHLLGNRPVTDYLADPLEKSENGCILTGQGGSTSIDGVFAVGDISCRDVRQISLAVSEGMRAALSAQAKLSGRSAPSSQWGIRS
jgi:thioredoxin reductase (NADPH)